MFIVDRSRQHVSTLKESSSGLIFETSLQCTQYFKDLFQTEGLMMTL